MMDLLDVVILACMIVASLEWSDQPKVRRPPELHLVPDDDDDR